MYCVHVCCCCVCVCVLARAHTHIHTIFFSLSLFFCLYCLSPSFVSISLCMHVIWYNTKNTHTHTHTQGRGYICGHYFQGARLHPTSYFHEQTEEFVHNRVKCLAGQANGQRHAQYLLDLWLQGIRKQLTNHLRHALWRKPSMMLRESTTTHANFS
jgi:hypothetical protein